MIYEVDGDPSIAVKLYVSDKTAAERAEKVKAMVAAKLYSATSYAAFPIEAVFDASNKFVGFTMRLAGQRKQIHNLCTPGSRKTLFPKADFRFLLRTALNICRAVASIHTLGCVIGDV